MAIARRVVPNDLTLQSITVICSIQFVPTDQ